MQPITRVNPGVISPNRRNKSTVPNLPDRTRSANSLFIESEINLSSAQYLCFHLSGVGERQCGSKLTVSRKLSPTVLYKREKSGGWHSASLLEWREREVRDDPCSLDSCVL